MERGRRGAVAVAVAAATWGSWKLWFPPGGTLDPAAQGAMILTVSSISAGLLALLSRPEGLDRARRSDGLLLVAFGVSEAANYLCYFRALAAGDSAAASVTHYLAPVLVAFASVLLRQPLGRRTAFAIPVAFVSTLVLAGLGAGQAGTRTAALFGTASAVFYAANIIVSKRLSRCFGPWALVGLHNAVAAPIVWAFARTPPWRAPAHEILLATTGALVGGTLAAGIYFYGLARLPAAKAAALSYVEPVSASIVGALVLGEPTSPARLVATVVILAAGVAVATDASPTDAVPEASVVNDL